MRSTSLYITLFFAVSGPLLAAQERDAQPELTPRNNAAILQRVADTPTPDVGVSVPAGTRIPLTLKQGITTKNAREGDPVYAQTAFPIVQNDHIVIPVGTFVQGNVRRVLRPGRVKGRAELQISFTSMIFPNGYTVLLPGAVQGTPGSPDSNVVGKEGTIRGRGDKAKDVGTVVGSSLPGAGIGAIAGGAKGAGIGAGVGGVIGLATVLLTRGPELQLGPGASIEMVLERTLSLDNSRLHRTDQ